MKDQAEMRISLLPEEKMAIVNRIEFCDAAKNSGVVLYVRKFNKIMDEYQPDLLDQEILDLIHIDYPDAVCHSRKIEIDADIEEIQRLAMNLNKETRQIRITHSIEIIYVIIGESFDKDLEIYCYDEKLRYPKSQISIKVQNHQEFEYYEKTYMTFSDYLLLLGKSI